MGDLVAASAIDHSDDGTVVRPTRAEEWTAWVSASSIRNSMLGDPLLDWLDLYGHPQGWVPDEELPGYDPRADFTRFVSDQGKRFEGAVLDVLRSAGLEIVEVAKPGDDSRDPDLASATFDLISSGVVAIWQGVLRDPENLMYGIADLLVRSDVLHELFPDALTPEDAGMQARDVNGRGHYRVVEVKFTTLHLNAKGLLGNDGSQQFYKAQLHVLNRALGRLQGYTPEHAYLLGRGWEQKIKGEILRGRSCLDRLAAVNQSGELPKGLSISDAVRRSADWVRAVRRFGGEWILLPVPSRPELYPNMGNDRDGPWHAAKRQIVADLEDVTALWQVGLAGRARAHDAGVLRWTDPRCTPELLGLSEGRAATLQAMLDINRAMNGPVVMPERIERDEAEWRPVPQLEFYVDFETVTDLADDFSLMPERGGQALIFMIGCGHVEDGSWAFRTFTARDLSEESEAVIIDNWFAHMEETTARLAPGTEPRLIHWSPAEESMLDTAFNSARARHPDDSWPNLNWYDFLGRVVRSTPVVVKGSLGFGLKSVAKALAAAGLIDTTWSDGPTDGLGAMMGAWWCQDVARESGQPFYEVPPMREIEQYNEIDCRVMMEAVAYLRANH